MIEIVPAILTDSPKEFKKIAERLVEAGVRRVHLDIADGVFVPMGGFGLRQPPCMVCMRT